MTEASGHRDSGPCPVGEAVARAVEAEGVTCVFGIVGSHIVALYDALADRPDLRAVTPGHEVGAAFMAAAYARITGDVGVCLTTAGPGVLNALNGLGQAQFSSLPVVLIAGGVPRGARPFELHGLEDEGFLLRCAAPLVKHAVRVDSADAVGPCLAEAFAVARSGRPGPAYVEIPWDLLGPGVVVPGAYRPRPTAQATPTPGRAEIAGALAGEAAKVLLVLDKPVLHAPLRHDLVEAARARRWRIAVSRDGLGAVSTEDPLFAGVVHDHSFGPFGAEALAEADLVVAVGFDAGSGGLEMLGRFGGRRVVELGAADVAPFLAHAPPRIGAAWGRAPRPVRLARAEGGPVDFASAVAALAPHLGEDDTVVVDSGNHEVWARSILPVRRPHGLIGGGDWASMGFAVPSAAGVRVARPHRRIVCVTGDGCLLMSLMDLPTLVRLGGPTLILNLNDAGYGMMKQVQRRRFGRDVQSDLPRMDYAALARVFGAQAARVTDVGQLSGVLSAALSANVPWFVDVVCDGPPPVLAWEDPA